MKKRGFTLIELLAVIVVLAVVALIAFPIIAGIIEKTKRSAAYRSVEGYVEAANNAAVLYDLDNNKGINVT
ncbi:MAG: prepilin-type N-terminal cleavage/methylation domain-containing protein, partial [Bacilli bacterium]|nr:prepilin-type N-terminal cleavage/methylation domain-containing protein [Bacilli bacterium]